MATREQALKSLALLTEFIAALPPGEHEEPPGPQPPAPAPLDARAQRIKAIDAYVKTLPDMWGQTQVDAPGDMLLRARDVVSKDNLRLLEIGLAVFEWESLFINTMHCDAGAPFCHQPATPERVTALVNQPGYRQGEAPMQGIGLPGLTWYEYVLRAQNLGGAWKPYAQCVEGFTILYSYMQNGWPLERILGSYNAGPGNWNKVPHYVNSVSPLVRAWERRLDVAPAPKPGEPKDAEILSHGVVDGTNFAKAYKVALQLLGRDYWIWSSGVVPSGEGMYAINRPLPPLNQIGRVNCTGLGNIMRRAAGKIVPTRGNELYDGGVAAYFYCPASFPGVGVLGPGFFSKVDVPFNMATAKKWARETGSGVALGRSYVNNTLAGQGHFAVLLPDGMVLQSITLGGVNINYTIEESNGDGYYQWMVHPDDWINHNINNI